MYDYGGNEYWGSSEQSGMTPVVRNLLIANLVIYFGMLILHGFLGRAIRALEYDQMIRVIGFVPQDALENFHLWQFVTYAFVHSKWPIHILFNMYILWWAGTDVERQLGRREFTWLYVLAIVFSVMFQIPSAYLWSHAVATPVVGASGAIMALLVVFAGLFPERRIYFFVFGPFSARAMVFIFIALDLAWLLSEESQIAAAVHLGGAAFGFAYLRLRSWVEKFFDDLQNRMEEEERLAKRNLNLDLDNVLRKIHKEGISSLTRDERAILDKASEHFREDTP